MINTTLVLKKLAKLKSYLEELEDAVDCHFDEYMANNLIRRSAERLLILIVEVASDINSHLSAKILKTPPANYFNSFIRLSEIGILDAEFARQLAMSAGLRNRLIHEYEEVDDRIVYDCTKNALSDYPKYIEAIYEFVKSPE